MSISLAGIALPEDTIWIDRDTLKKHSMKKQKALNGALVVNVLPGVTSTKNITLQCPWMRYADAIAIRALMNEEPDPDEPLSLEYEGSLYDVLFDLEDENPVKLLPVIERPTYEDDDEFDVVIKLFSVE